MPRNLDTDYEQELHHIFRYNAAPGQELNISKIVLVYDIDYLIELEEKIQMAIKRKQEFLEKYGFRD